jgi:VCBS repeat-containing protein
MTRFSYLSMLLIFLVSLVGIPNSSVNAAASITFTGEELLGKPEDTSITVNIVPATTIEYHYQYSTTSGGTYTNTSNVTATGGQPSEVVISGLTPNTHYYYRMQYHAPGDAMDDWVTRSEHSFWTQRTKGSSFSFSVTSDSHASFSSTEQNTMTNILNEHPDFEIDLGDTFMLDGTTSQTAVNNAYLAFREPLYFDKIGNSVPIFLTSGNHEDEEGWNLDDTPFSIAQASIQARKLYYPTPIQDGFYSGNTDPLAAINASTYGDQYREDYYAWTWGDALFVVIDEFQYTMSNPYGSAAGEGSDDPATGDQWNWTLGAQQFNWFKQTLQNSDAKYKFVFCHQMLGGIPNLTVAGAGPGYVRGGAQASAYFEWGGENADGSAGFAAHRDPAAFGTVPIHQLMVQNGVTAYFHGHDHQYVYETTSDGIVYQEVPSAGTNASAFSGIYTTSDHGTYNTIKMLGNSGHLLVTINPTQGTVDYISATNTSGTVNYSYNLAPHVSGPTHVLTTAVNPSGGGTINPAAGVHNFNEGDVVSVTATANTGYTLSGWSGSGACTGTTNPCPVTMSGDMSITANFATIPTYILTTAVSPSGGGTINPAAGDHTYNQGEVVSVMATANTGYTLSSWSGSGACAGSTNPCSVTMSAAKSITANFTVLPTYVLTTAVSPSGGGTINPAVGAHTYNSGVVVPVTASANSGYTFSGWSGGACSGSGACNVTMDAAKSVTATFNAVAATITFTGTELLGRPEANSISVSVVPNSDITLYYEWGTSSGNYTGGGPSTQTTATAGTPKVVVMSGLTANTHYFYRMQYSTDGGATWTARPEKSFWTQRATGSTFTFDITSDSHVNIQLGNSSNWTSTLNGVAADNPDFHIDLGDTFAMDNGSTSVTLGDTASAEQKYKDALPFFNIVSGSTPLFLVAGNHEQQEAWHLQGTLANSLPVMGKNAEKKFYLNPLPDSFYTGDMGTYSYLSGDQYKQDYYAWTWGDALFVVISPFWTTTTKPYTTTAGGGETDATGSGNRWDWTLGLTQFNWLQSTLSGSSAKYKFVFAHQIVGGNGMTSPVNQVNYGHGGVDSANLVEWGGYDVGGVNNTWATNRPGWGSLPIGPMMVANHVTAFFHGHDHQDAHESLNGMVYQSVPSGSFTGSFGNYSTGGNSGNTIWADSTQGPGHLKVTVSPTQTTVDFIRYNASSAANSYTMAPNVTTTCYALTLNHTGQGIDPVASPTKSAACSSNGLYVSGEVISLSGASPTSGWQINSWTGTANDSSTAATNSLTMPANAKTVSVNYTQIPPTCYGLTLNHTGQGGDPVASPVKSTGCTSNGQYVSGEAISLSGALPTTGWQIHGWTGTANDSSTAATNSLSMPASVKTVSVNYTQIEYTLTTSVVGSGSINRNNAGPYHYNDSVQLTAVPVSGWSFSAWSGDLSGSVNPTNITINGNKSVTATFSVINVAPVAVIDTYSTNEDVVLNVSAPGVLSNDTDANLDSLTAIKVTNPAHGVLALNSNGSFTYTPSSGYTGDDSFTYKANDGKVDSNTVTVTIHVNMVNPPPGLPSSFYGEIHYFTNPPTAGQLVEAFIQGGTSAVASTAIKNTTPLTYSFDVPADQASTPAKDGGTEGDVITFKINGRVVATGGWHSGTSVRLDFHPPEAVPGGPYSGNEGASINFNGSASDWGSTDASVYQWDWDNNGSYDVTGQAPSHSWTDNGSYTVGLKVTDAQGGEGTTTFSVSVADVLPTNVSAGGPYNGSTGQPVSLTGSATCASVDTCTYAWDLDGDAAYDDATGASTSNVWNAVGDYPISLRVTDDDGNAVTAAATVHITNTSQSISLVSGWNLVSFNLHPANTDPATVLSSITGHYDLVYAWNAANSSWMKYSPGVGYGDTLTNLDETMGFWIRTTAAATLIINGTSPGTSNIALKSGWNLVGYPSRTNLALPDAFSLHGVSTDFSLVYAYHANDTGDPWKKYDRTASIGNDLLELAPAWGYWVKVGSAHTWGVGY